MARAARVETPRRSRIRRNTPNTPSTPTRTDIAPAAGSEWFRKAVFYEVFVRSFQDSNGDGKGDLKGLLSRLDYLNDGDPNTTQDLGVDALWLMPVFDSPSYHGYDVVDYERVEPDYGTLEDFELLCAEAHSRGMQRHPRLRHQPLGGGAPVVRGVRLLAHVRRSAAGTVEGAGIRAGSSRGASSRTTATWHPRNGAYYYGVFWDGMPDLNLQNAELRAEVKRLASLWLVAGRGWLPAGCGALPHRDGRRARARRTRRRRTPSGRSSPRTCAR